MRRRGASAGLPSVVWGGEAIVAVSGGSWELPCGTFVLGFMEILGLEVWVCEGQSG
ncbi:MAG: hypothetical protein RL215_879 [Planctomycetota bacterium]